VPNYVPVITFRQARSSRNGPIGVQLLKFERRAKVGGAQGEMTMKNPLDSLWGTIICGLILTVILYLAVKNFLM